MRAARPLLLFVVLLMLAPAPAPAAFDDPLFFYTPQEPPPVGLNSPCGLAVSANGDFYVSDYYNRAVDVFGYESGEPKYKGQPLGASGPTNPHTGTLDDPCALALDSTGTLYLNNYHRNVVRFSATDTVIDSGDPLDIYANPTGVAVDPNTDRVYVDDRHYVSVYDPSGNPVLAGGGGDLHIGEGSLEDGYGIAVSGYPATAGRIYVPDAATETVKVFDPVTGAPLQSISGPPGGGFGSLRDSAIAIDEESGEIYVIDTKGTQFTERPQASVYVFLANGSYEGRLKYNTVNAAPTGIAVDNSGGPFAGRVYVTSGITEHASIYGYPPGAATNAAAPPLESTASPTSAPRASGTTSGRGLSDLTPQETPASASASSTSQKGTLRVSVGGELRPKRLPRKGTAPIAVTVGGQISTTDESLPPSLQELRIDINRHGKLDYAGLPTCPYGRIQPGSSSHALAACRSSLVGKGAFSADITLSGQAPYPTKGRLLVFNGTRHGKPVLYGHIYAPRPFATSFVIVFSLKSAKRGTYGTSLIAPLPKAMKAWGRLTGIQMTLSRRYSYKGERHSYISAGCPAPEGVGRAIFPLARTSFAFAGGMRLSSVLSGTCRVGG